MMFKELCEFCNGSKSITIDKVTLSMREGAFDSYPYLRVYTSFDPISIYKFDVNFCPMCGRNLKDAT